MKKLKYLLIAFIVIGLASCQNPAKSRIYMDEGNKQMMRYSDYEKADELLSKAIKYDKNNYEAYYLRGCAKINAKKYQDAIEDFEKAIELKPDYADAYFNTGRAYSILRDNDRACEYYLLAQKYGRPNLDDYIRNCK